MQNWSKLVFVLTLCNNLIVTGEKKNPTLSFLRYRVVPARQVPFPGSPEGSPGNGTWLAGTTLSRRMTAWDSLSICIVGYMMIGMILYMYCWLHDDWYDIVYVLLVTWWLVWYCCIVLNEDRVTRKSRLLTQSDVCFATQIHVYVHAIKCTLYVLFME